MRTRLRILVLALAALGLVHAVPAPALETSAAAIERLALGFFARADRLAPADPASVTRDVLRGGQVLGYVFETDRIVRIPGYSGRPIGLLVAVGRDGLVAGVAIVRHAEPILGAGIAERDLREFVSQYVGKPAARRFRVGARPGGPDVAVDAISGATITTMVINASIDRALRATAGGKPRAPIATSARQGPDHSLNALWPSVWRTRIPRIVILMAGLLVLTVLLLLQDWVARYPRVTRTVRVAFLVYTLVVIGWYASAQLSVINVLTFVKALMGGFHWETFLIDPLLFILWSYVAVVLLLWGRGVYCGWLCPFGALQELVNIGARKLGLRQWPIPELVHDRLLACKYVIMLGLFGVFLYDVALAARCAEIEPFKTAISLRFARDWTYVSYAALLVVVSAVNGKFFCKYLCPLGAALAISSHFRIFDWLRRRVECGHPCQTCATECSSQAIRPNGEINASECHYCLDCQLTYWNAYKCPPLVERRKRFERRGQRVKLR